MMCQLNQIGFLLPKFYVEVCHNVNNQLKSSHGFDYNYKKGVVNIDCASSSFFEKEYLLCF